MNLNTLNINEGWPTQSQFYYSDNNNLKTNNYDNNYSIDNNSKINNHYDAEPSPCMFNYPCDNEALSEAFYSRKYHPTDQEIEEYTINDRKSKHYTTTFNADSNFCALDTCNSNCPISSRNSYIANYGNYPLTTATSQHSRNSSINDNYGDRKFISEIHINIKEPCCLGGGGEVDSKSTSNSYSKFPNDYASYSKAAAANAIDNNNHQTAYHISNFETFISSQHNEIEIPTRSRPGLSELRSSSQSPNRKRECHHSEKFIYLGCDAQLTPQIVSDVNNEINSYNSQLVYDKNLQKPLYTLSRSSDVNEDLKSFSTKSVQTSKKIDCIFKSTCDRSMVTDVVLEESNQKSKEVLQESKLKPTKIYVKPENSENTASSESENESLSSEHFSEIKYQKYQIRIEKPENVKHESPIENKLPKPNSKGPVKNIYQPAEDANQDTYAGSYSESFTESDDINELPVKDKPAPIEKPNEEPIKNPLNKLDVKKPSIVKANVAVGNNKPVQKSKPRKGFSERKDSLKIKEKNCCFNETKQNHVSREDTERHSFEIQCLLDNLNTHLQNTVNSHNKPSKTSSSKVQNNQFTNIGSFWDNPLNPETTRSLLLGRQMTPKVSEPRRQKSINPEIQALFESLEKSNNQDKVELQRMNQKKSPSIDMNTRNQKLHNMSIGENHLVKVSGDGLGSVDNLHDSRFPQNLKFQKSFDLSPYDELVKSHLNASDRRIKSVAAKNGCRIVIDGPISLVDPTTTCQAIRNKIAYRCAVGGPSKDRLDKCLNYLKETFPNTCLRLHSRNNLGIKN